MKELLFRSMIVVIMSLCVCVVSVKLSSPKVMWALLFVPITISMLNELEDEY